jgi:ElaB/YqjD/DUF883 family membrane-anchored ribosome-binding protein
MVHAVQSTRRAAMRSPAIVSLVTMDAWRDAKGVAMSEVNKERLMSDIRTVLADAEDLLKQAASTTGERASELRETALTRLKQAKEKAADMQVVVVEKGKKAARATDDYVHEHPWTSIGIAAGIGVLVGLLINRK